MNKQLLERFQALIAQDIADPGMGLVLAREAADQVERLVAALVPKPLRRAVLERPRLVDEWPLGGRWCWPNNVAADDVSRALERTGDKQAKVLAAGLAKEGVSHVLNIAPRLINKFADAAIAAMADRLEEAASDKAKAAVEKEWAPFLGAYEAVAEAQNTFANMMERGEEVSPQAAAALTTAAETFQILFRDPPQLFQQYLTKLENGPDGWAAVLDAHQATIRWPIGPVAMVVSVMKNVEDDQRRPAVRVSAKPPSRSALHALSEGAPRGDLTNWDRAWPDGAGGYALVLNGKRQQVQLALRLPDVGADLSASLVRHLLDTFKADGVRDWLVLHDMAQRQGGSGRFRWSWKEHSRLGGYDRRCLNAKGYTEQDIAKEVVRRLVAFKGTELRVEVKRGTQTVWRRVGDFGLIDIPAGVDELLDDGTRLTTVAEVKLNAGLYRGAAVGERNPYFALVEQGALQLSRIPQMLAVFIALNARVARDAGGVVRLNARTLWEYAGIAGRTWTARKRWPRARVALERALNELADTSGWTWEREDDEREIPDTVYRMTPPTWWTDRVLLGVPATPALPSKAGVPMTGAELRDWRTKHGVTLRAVGERVGASKDAVARAERKADAALPDGWTDKLAVARKALRRG